MKTIRPAVTKGDDFLTKIIKYIPAEVIAVYTAIIGLLKGDQTLPDINFPRLVTYTFVFIIIVLVTPFWTYFSTLDRSTDPLKKKRAIFHAIVATFSLCVWIYAIGDVVFRSFLLKYVSWLPYDSVTGSVILILFTGLLVPLLERVIFGKPGFMFSGNKVGL